MTPWQGSHVQNVLGPSPSSPWSTELPRTHLSSLGSRRRGPENICNQLWLHLENTSMDADQFGATLTTGLTQTRKEASTSQQWHLGQVTRHPPTYASFPLSYQHPALGFSPQTRPRLEKAAHQPPWPCRRQERQVEYVLDLFPLTPRDQGTEEGALGFP